MKMEEVREEDVLNGGSDVGLREGPELMDVGCKGKDKAGHIFD